MPALPNFGLTRERIADLTARARGRRIAVVGDVMLDRYLMGDTDRLSPEAPVPVVHVRETRMALGGAANVAANVAALGAEVRLVGIVGDDTHGNTIRTELAQQRLPDRGLLTVAGRPTTTKTRVVARTQQIVRIDEEIETLIEGAELERLTALDPSFAAGLSYLGAIEAVAYVHGFTDPNDALALDRALKFARRGVELKPHSAFAYHILFVVLFFRGETEAARAAAENAIALNPYDLAMRADYGGRLIFAGELDQGMDILRDTAPFGAILPSWTHFYLFLGHYLRDELAEARFHAGQLTNDTHIYGQLARALMAHRDGQANEARRTIQAITSAQPHWKADPRREIGKLITGNALADRLARELVDAGLT